MYLLITFRKSTLPQLHQLNILISNSEQQVDDSLTFYCQSTNTFCETSFNLRLAGSIASRLARKLQTAARQIWLEDEINLRTIAGQHTGMCQHERDAIPCAFILHKVSLKSSCKSQFPHKSVNLFFILVIGKEKLTDLWGSSLLRNDSKNTLCEISLPGLNHVEMSYTFSNDACSKHFVWDKRTRLAAPPDPPAMSGESSSIRVPKETKCIYQWFINYFDETYLSISFIKSIAPQNYQLSI